MKHIPILLIFLAGGLLQCACTRTIDTTVVTPTDTSTQTQKPDTSGKTKPPPPDTPKTQVKPGPHDLYLKVLEFQTNIPLASAKYTKLDCSALSDPSTCPLQGRPVVSFTSDSNGYILVKGYDTLSSSGAWFPVMTKDQYWDRWSYDSTYQIDSIKYAVVHLYPKAWLNIHLKNQLYHDSTRSIIFRFEPNLFQPGYPSEYSGSSAHYFSWFDYRFLSYGEINLDATFLVPTLAFVENDISVFEGTSAHNDQIQIYSAAKTIGKFETLDVDIVF